MKPEFVEIFEMDAHIEALGQTYMVLLLECLSVLSELLEDEDEYCFGKYTSTIIK